jgi:hypothetical protein
LYRLGCSDSTAIADLPGRGPGAALALAITPGPEIFYVLARSLRGGRREGVLSSGTFFGGVVL